MRMYFKEYRIWYFLYGLLFLSFWIIFELFHVPVYFLIISFLCNGFSLTVFSIIQFLRFQKKLKTLQHFIYVYELESFTLPSEIAYFTIIQQLSQEQGNTILEYKTQESQINDLIKMWSHQMKIPLSALSLMAQTEHLTSKNVQQQLLQLDNHLNNLLSYLKFNQNQDDYRFEQFSINSITKEIVKKYATICITKSLSISIDGDWLITSDRKWMTFILNQIIDNAIKYSIRSSDIIIKIENKSISIQDKGIGILDEDIPRLFEEGFTGFNGHEHQKATGLGLYMAKQIADKLGLSILITSQVDKGTTVTVFQR